MTIKAAAADHARSAVAVAVADGKLLLLNMPAALSLLLMMIKAAAADYARSAVAAADVREVAAAA